MLEYMWKNHNNMKDGYVGSLKDFVSGLNIKKKKLQEQGHSNKWCNNNRFIFEYCSNFYNPTT